jgi:lipopolysaccharide heptosyltransferase II
MYRIFNKKKRRATMLADAVGRVLWAPARLQRDTAPVRPELVESILVIRTAYIGDVVLATPMLRPLKERFPGASLSFLTSRASAPLLEHNPWVDEILAHDPFWFYPRPGGARQGLAEHRAFMRGLRGRRWDLIIEARGDIREILMFVRPLRARYKVSYGVGGGDFLLSHVVPHPEVNHRVRYHLDMARFLGADVDEHDLDWGVYLTTEEQEAVEAVLERAGVARPFCAAHPGSRVPLKRWPAERYARAFDLVAERTGLPVVLLGAPDEREQVRAVAAAMRTPSVDLSGALSLRQLAGVLERAALFVGNDSAPMHLAAAADTPQVALFGPSKPDQTGPFSPVARVAAKEFSCRAACDETVCTHPRHNACMTDLEPEDVVRALASLPQDVLRR